MTISRRLLGVALDLILFAAAVWVLATQWGIDRAMRRESSPSTRSRTSSSIVIALVGYRLVSFILPLALATVLWSGREARRWIRR
jgi:hypothetical protein